MKEDEMRWAGNTGEKPITQNNIIGLQSISEELSNPF
jgi:hypothetical protein